MIKVTLPIETPVIHVPLSGRVGGTLSHKSYSSLSWEDQTANGHLHGQSPRSGFAVIGPFEPMPSGTGIAPPRCHPPPDGGTLRHVNNSLPGPVSEGSVHGNGSRQPDNWLSALADPFVTVLAHGNGVTDAAYARHRFKQPRALTRREWGNRTDLSTTDLDASVAGVECGLWHCVAWWRPKNGILFANACKKLSFMLRRGTRNLSILLHGKVVFHKASNFSDCDESFVRKSSESG